MLPVLLYRLVMWALPYRSCDAVLNAVLENISCDNAVILGFGFKAFAILEA